MNEVNLLEGYPQPKEPRKVARNLRTVHHRIIASQRGKDFFDGDRNYGYGGYKYDGRWVPIAERIINHYGLQDDGSVLHINCEEGFLLHDLKQARPSMTVHGTETSEYAIENAMESIKDQIHKATPVKLPFPDHSVDFVIALSLIYTMTLPDAMTALREIGRVGKGNSFITLATYETDEEYFLFKDWTLLGTLMFRKEEWIEILEHVGYSGDYAFTGAQSLNLVRAQD